MQKSKIYVDPNVIDKIIGSDELTDKQKLRALHYIRYMTGEEQKNYAQLV